MQPKHQQPQTMAHNGTRLWGLQQTKHDWLPQLSFVYTWQLKLENQVFIRWKITFVGKWLTLRGCSQRYETEICRVSQIKLTQVFKSAQDYQPYAVDLFSFFSLKTSELINLATFCHLSDADQLNLSQVKRFSPLKLPSHHAHVCHTEFPMVPWTHHQM